MASASSAVFGCWRRVVEWELDALVVLSWQLTSQCRFDPDPARASEVAVRFTADSPGITRVSLEHRHFERHGADAGGVRSSVAGEQGWEGVLRRFSDHVADAA